MAADAKFYWDRDFSRAAELYVTPGVRRRVEAQGWTFQDRTSANLHFDFTYRNRRGSLQLLADVKRSEGYAKQVVELVGNYGQTGWGHGLDRVVSVKQLDGVLKVRNLDLRKFREDTCNFTKLPPGVDTAKGREGSDALCLYIPIEVFTDMGCAEDMTAEVEAAYQLAYGSTPPEALFTPDPRRDTRPMPTLNRPISPA